MIAVTHYAVRSCWFHRPLL